MALDLAESILLHGEPNQDALAQQFAAIYIALRHLTEPFENPLRFIISCGGDADTIGAMAGALWGSGNGHADLPMAPLEGREHIESVSTKIFRGMYPPVE
jgi:ADP-ribosylglycohydrolase